MPFGVRTLKQWPALIALVAMTFALSCRGRKPYTPSPKPETEPPPEAAETLPQEEARALALAQASDADVAPSTPADDKLPDAPGALEMTPPSGPAGMAEAATPRTALSEGDSAPSDDADLEAEYLKAILEGAEGDLDQVQQRISYPDDLYGGAVIRSSDKPGEVTLFYPLRSVGGASVNVKGYEVSISAPAQAAVDAVVKPLQKYLQDGETTVWFPHRNMLEITAQEENIPFIKDMLDFLDQPKVQIIIEAAVWEVTDINDTELGAQVNISKRDGGRSFFNLFNSRFDTQAFVNSLTSVQPYQGGTLDFVTSADANHAQMNLVFQFLKNKGYADLVSQPRMRVAVGQTASIVTGEEVPIQGILKLNRNAVQSETKYKTVGVQLYVTPMIANQDTITLSVVPVVSEIAGYTDSGPTGISVPIIINREAKTQVTVANRELITIGGLDQTRKTITESKIPILGDIPVLRYFFSYRREVTKKVQLWFTVQPTIAGDTTRIIVPELTGLTDAE